VADTKRTPLGQDFQAALLKEGFRASSKRSKPGARNKKLLSAVKLSELRSKLRTRGPIGRIAALYIDSKMRVSEFLALSKTEAHQRLHCLDGAWLQNLFLNQRASKLWETFAESQRAAYKQLLDLVRAEHTDLETIYRSKVQQV